MSDDPPGWEEVLCKKWGVLIGLGLLFWIIYAIFTA